MKSYGKSGSDVTKNRRVQSDMGKQSAFAKPRISMAERARCDVARCIRSNEPPIYQRLLAFRQVAGNISALVQPAATNANKIAEHSADSSGESLEGFGSIDDHQQAATGIQITINEAKDGTLLPVKTTLVSVAAPRMWPRSGP